VFPVVNKTELLTVHIWYGCRIKLCTHVTYSIYFSARYLCGIYSRDISSQLCASQQRCIFSVEISQHRACFHYKFDPFKISLHSCKSRSGGTNIVVCPTVKMFEDNNVCLQRGDNTAVYHAVETSNTIVLPVIKISQHSNVCCVQDDKTTVCCTKLSQYNCVSHSRDINTVMCPVMKISQHSCLPCTKDISKQLCALK